MCGWGSSSGWRCEIENFNVRNGKNCFKLRVENANHLRFKSIFKVLLNNFTCGFGAVGGNCFCGLCGWKFCAGDII